MNIDIKLALLKMAEGGIGKPPKPPVGPKPPAGTPGTPPTPKGMEAPKISPIDTKGVNPPSQPAPKPSASPAAPASAQQPVAQPAPGPKPFGNSPAPGTIDRANTSVGGTDRQSGRAVGNLREQFANYNQRDTAQALDKKYYGNSTERGTFRGQTTKTTTDAFLPERGTRDAAALDDAFAARKGEAQTRIARNAEVGKYKAGLPTADETAARGIKFNRTSGMGSAGELSGAGRSALGEEASTLFSRAGKALGNVGRGLGKGIGAAGQISAGVDVGKGVIGALGENMQAGDLSQARAFANQGLQRAQSSPMANTDRGISLISKMQNNVYEAERNQNRFLVPGKAAPVDRGVGSGLEYMNMVR